MEPVPDWGTIPRMLRDQAARHPDDVVVAEGGTPLTMRALREEAARVARGLIALGVEPGDRVAVWAPNSAAWVVIAYGVWDAGAIVTPLSTRFRGIEAAGMLRRTGARVLFVDEGFLGFSYLGALQEICGGPSGGRPFGDLPNLRHAVTLAGTGAPPPAVSFEDLLERGEHVADAEERALAVGPDDLAEIMATSGTTGAPKGVMLPHAQLLRGYWDWASIVTLGPDDRYPIIAPFSHGFGINAGLLACVLKRATMMPISVFAPDTLMDLIERDRISVLAGPPTLFHRILEELDGRDVTSLRVAICGAAAVPPELIRRLIERVGLDRMINAYGLMEGTVVSMTRAEDPVEVIAATTGRAVPGVTVRVVDDEGKDLPAGGRGEILIGGYGVMRGYWDDPERTAEAVDADGWLHTGDIGELTARGDLAIVDRKKDMFIVGGFNAYPAEIEALLLHHPAVAQAAVVAVPDERLGEVGWAFVVPAGPVEPATIVAWARDHMSNYKVPRQVVLVDTLPANVNGKVDKQALRARTRTARTLLSRPGP
ncbi:AMP-binding protein [Actinoallomurus sp. NPDC050550]|uniref:AMP-binding protein n=1 Tax=Actinoallomurus sp. NPDC050550 TaxID=3154937 RepID=UPI0033FF8FA1